MPILGNALDFAKYEAKQMRAHQLGAAPSSPVTGQLYYNTADNTLYWWDGSQWVSSRGGAAATPPATTTALGTVQLAGDLAGTATAPVVANGAVTDSKVAAANKDGAVGTASMRTLGAGAQQAMPGNRTLDAISPPVASVNMNGQKITGLVPPAVTTDAANKGYVDNAIQGLSARNSVRAATTGNIALTGSQVIDGVTLDVDGNRILVKNQTDPKQNGIYMSASGAWTRTPDADTWDKLVNAFVFVEKGTVNADTGWVCTIDAAAGSIGTANITWAQFSGAGSFVDGAGLLKTGNTLDVVTDNSTLEIASDQVRVKDGGITDAKIASVAPSKLTAAVPVSKGGTGATNADLALNYLGAPKWYAANGPPSGAASTWTITQATHGINSADIIVQVSDGATGNIEIPDINVNRSNGSVTITYGASVAQASKRVLLIGAMT